MSTGANNSHQRDQIEQIVREVLASLAGKSAAVAAASASELVLTSKVVSLKEIEGRLAGVSRVVVPRGAVFTPTAREELRKFRVSVASAVPASRQQVSQKLVLAATAGYAVAPLIAVLERDGVAVERVEAQELVTVIDRLTNAAKSGVAALLLTEQSSLAVCLANRCSGVRGALASSVAGVAEAIEHVAPNMLVVDPRGKGTFELRQLVRAWLSRGLLPCPASLQKQLG